jgi:glyoxalase family protein
VHHIAWSIGLGEEDAWQQLIARTGLQPTPVIDRFYFRSVYYREPSGILYELATRGPGFTSDEPKATLGEALSLPPNFEPLRERVAAKLTPLPDVTQWRPKD